MTSLRQADRLARRRAQSEFQRPVVLEAGAGTGKTTTLVARVLAWCLGQGWEKHAGGAASSGDSPGPVAAAVLRRVVAITFTEAAAAEMAGRIAEELASIAGGGRPVGLLTEGLPPRDELAHRARALAGALDHLTVRTIHAFCRSLLADHPLEAGLHPHFEIDATGLLVEEVCREVVEASLGEAYGGSEESPFLYLAARGVGPEALVSALVGMIQEGISPAVLEEDPLSPDRVEALLERAASALASAVAAGADLAGVSRRSKVTLETVQVLERTQELLAEVRSAPGGAPAALERLLAELPTLWVDNLLGRLGTWARGTFNKGEGEALGHRRGELSVAAGEVQRLLRHLLGMDPDLLQAGRKALFPLLEEATEVLRRRGVLTFSALLVETGRLLAGHAGVRRRLRRRLDQLLVDEFQDTDRLQCDLVRRLALEGPVEERPGLFLVGDPKQSIYGWRSADLAAYDGFLEEVRRHGGEVHGLSENFRSVPAILQEVERSVSPVMEARRGLQPAFQPLFPCAQREGDEGFTAAGRRPLEAWVSWGDEGSRTSSADAAALEAAAVARDLQELHGTGVAWKDVGLLLRSAGELDVYLEALRSAGIPFAVGRDKQYYQRREIIDAVALVRTVLDPGDQLALLTLLRSVLVGVPDAALLPLWTAGLPRKMIDQDRAGVEEIARRVASNLPRSIPGLERIDGWEENLVAAAARLESLRRTFRDGTAAEFVHQLRRLFAQEVLESARYLGRYRVANLQRFYRQLQEGLEAGGDVTGLLRFLRRSIAESTAAEEGRLLDSGADAVQVLTIHGAKGLGFEHVYLLQLHKADPPGTVAELSFAKVGNRHEYSLFGAMTPGYDRVRAATREREAAERVRLLYVALTRAKRRLVLVGKWPEELRPRPVAAARSMLDLLAHREPPAGRVDELRVLALEGAGGGGDGSAVGPFTDASGLRWVFPSAPLSTSEGSREPQGTLLAPPETSHRARRRLEELRRDATLRGSRPLAGVPSGAKVGTEGGIEGDWESPLRAEELSREGLGGVGGSVLPGEGREEEVGAEGSERDLSDRRIAMASGTAVHRLLEELDLRLEPSTEIQRRTDRLERYLPQILPEGDRPRALDEAHRVISKMAEGRLLSRLFTLGENVLARELPVLLPAPETGDGPLAFVSGVIDLLYRDPEDGRLVVADFKTDAVADTAAAQRRAADYAHQGAAYQDAVESAFELGYRPRFELWFLAADVIVQGV